MTDAATKIDAGAAAASDEDRTLTIIRHLKAPRDAVFEAWADPAVLVKWWGPEGVTVPDCRMDVRPGGAWRTVMRGPEGQTHTCSGVYREITPPERLEFTWAWEADGVRGHETVVTVVLHERDGGTEMVFTQRLFESAEGRTLHDEGWTSAFDCLDRYLAA